MLREAPSLLWNIAPGDTIRCCLTGVTALIEAHVSQTSRIQIISADIETCRFNEGTVEYLWVNTARVRYSACYIFGHADVLHPGFRPAPSSCMNITPCGAACGAFAIC